MDWLKLIIKGIVYFTNTYIMFVERKEKKTGQTSFGSEVIENVMVIRKQIL